jgi:GNAT superfamily N-acetyltransferase
MIMATVLAGSAPLERIRTLRDGVRVRLDLLGPADRADLLAGFTGLSRRSRYLRFFSAMGELPMRILDGLLNTDPYQHVAIGARLLDANGRIEGPIVGVARYFRTAGAADTAEPAVAVVDALHERGLGRLLLRAITAHARANGIARFRAHALADNSRIRQILLASQGVLVERDGPVVVYDIDIRAREVAPGGRLARLLRALIR